MVLYYAKSGSLNNLNNWIKNDKSSWSDELDTLQWIINGLKTIHEKKMVHRDFHIGNILLRDYVPYISDMGLCGEVGNMDPTNIYGVMPYVAPEVLRGKPYTQAADIYSFGMIMYFVATLRQPFANCAHDQELVLSICNGIRPEITEKEAPKCYIDLMKKCWDPNPDNRPNAGKIFKELQSFSNLLYASKDSENNEIKKQFEEAFKYKSKSFIY